MTKWSMFCTIGFLCSLSANTHGIEFLSFVIRDDESKRILFEVRNDAPMKAGLVEIDYDTYHDEDCYRAIKYTFSEDILRLPSIATRWVSAEQNQPHYFRRANEYNHFFLIYISSCCEYNQSHIQSRSRTSIRLPNDWKALLP